MKNQIENPNGLHQRYFVEKINKVPNPNYMAIIDKSSTYEKRKNITDEFLLVRVPVKKNAEYFLLKLNNDCNDPNHIKACRIALHAYAAAISDYLPELATDLIENYPLIK